MIHPPRLQYTSVRTRVVDGIVMIGLKHTARDEAGQTVKSSWIEMPPEDLERLVLTLLQTLEGSRSSA